MLHINRLVQERRNSSAWAMESHLSCINPTVYDLELGSCLWTCPWIVQGQILKLPYFILAGLVYINEKQGRCPCPIHWDWWIQDELFTWYALCMTVAFNIACDFHYDLCWNSQGHTFNGPIFKMAGVMDTTQNQDIFFYIVKPLI